jgi:transposase
VIVDHDNHRIVDVLENREKTTIVAYLTTAKTNGLLAQVEEVTTDMWDAFVHAAQEVFGESVRVTIDRFHVMKNFHDCLTQARRELQRGLPDEAREQLKGSRWWWVTNPENLRAEDRAALVELQRTYPTLAQLSQQRERLQCLLDSPHIRSAASGEQQLLAWVAEVRRLGLSGLEPFCRTLTNWVKLIANYFVSRSSNGRVEGFNHGIRVILWRAFGMTNFAKFRLRVLHVLGRK